jgi:hypothetical protein
MTREERCESPKTLEYMPDRPIEQLCSLLPRTERSASRENTYRDRNKRKGQQNQVKEYFPYLSEGSERERR